MADLNKIEIEEANEPVLTNQPRVEVLYGKFETVTAIPTVEPKTFVDQIKFYNGTNTLYFYDTISQTWIAV